MLTFDFETYEKNGIKLSDLDCYQTKIKEIKGVLDTHPPLTAWYDVESLVTDEELARILKVAKVVKRKCDIFLVIGIGGSYMGSKAIIDALNPYFKQESSCEVIYVGTSLSSKYLHDLMDYLDNFDVIVNVISKSGETLETKLTFDIILDYMKNRYPSDIEQRIIVTTDMEKGALCQCAKTYGFSRFIIPEQVGGRYSVLTPVGLLPMAVAGIDIESLLKGAIDAAKYQPEAYLYACIRDILYKEGKRVESFTVYEPNLEYFAEWLKQLFMETQGKDGIGLFTVGTINTRDLHSVGQYYQDGTNILFETVIGIKHTEPFYLTNQKGTIDDINQLALHSVAKSHASKNTPSHIIYMDEEDSFHMGSLIYFFECVAAIGGYLQGSNPFDQPGVTLYKLELEERLKESGMKE